jgi:hypothetical protein
MSFVTLRTFRRWLLDTQGLETGWVVGMVQDAERWRIPAGGSRVLTDYLIDQPGKLRKRGGTAYQSSAVAPSGWPGGSTQAEMLAVFCIDYGIDPRIIGICGNGASGSSLYDLTEATAGAEIPINVHPVENVTIGNSVEGGSSYPMAVVTDSSGGVGPYKVVRPGGPGSAVQLVLLGGSPPVATVSTTWNQYLVLAHSNAMPQRVFFSSDSGNYEDPGPGSDSTSAATGWTPPSFDDMNAPVMAMIGHGAVLILWTRNEMFRMTGTKRPPSVQASDPATNRRWEIMARTGCIDARSVVRGSSGVYFANENGVYLTDGAHVRSLTAGKGELISQLWRMLMSGFAVNQGHVLACGLHRDLYLIVTIYKGVGNTNTLICYLPTNGWSYLSANCAGVMYARSLATDQDQNDIYAAHPSFTTAGQNQLVKLAGIFVPTSANIYDANGDPVQPLWQSRVLPGNATSLRRFGNGRFVYHMQDSGGHNPTLTIYEDHQLSGNATWAQVLEGAVLPATTSVRRRRFRIYKDCEGVSFQVVQNGPSDMTDIHGVEYEMGSFFEAEGIGTNEP